MKLLIMQFSRASRPHLIGQIVLLCTLFSNTFSLYSSVNTKDSIIVLYMNLYVIQQQGSKHSSNLFRSLFRHECNCFVSTVPEHFIFVIFKKSIVYRYVVVCPALL
jgi:hypothetical protein